MFVAAGAACGCAATVLVQYLARRRQKEKSKRIVGVDFRGCDSTYCRASNSGVVGLLAYDICEPLTQAEYDKWLYEVHYHDLLANPFLERIELRTISKEKKAKLSSGADVNNKIEFFRMAELHFSSFEAYDKYLAWFRENAIPPPRTSAGKSAFTFYLLSESESIYRVSDAEPSQSAASCVPTMAVPEEIQPAGPATVLLIGSSGNIGMELMAKLSAMPGLTVLQAGRSASGKNCVQLDIYDVDSIKSLDAKLAGGVDHVVVCCGASIFGALESFDSEKWVQSCSNKLVGVTRLILMLANGKEVKCLRDGGSITVTAGQAARTVNGMWPSIATNNAGLEAMVKCAGSKAPRGVRINAVSPALVLETAMKAGLPTENAVPARDVAAAYLPLMFGTVSGQVVDAGVQEAFKKSHHAAQKDGIKP